MVAFGEGLGDDVGFGEGLAWADGVGPRVAVGEGLRVAAAPVEKDVFTGAGVASGAEVCVAVGGAELAGSAVGVAVAAGTTVTTVALGVGVGLTSR